MHACVWLVGGGGGGGWWVGGVGGWVWVLGCVSDKMSISVCLCKHSRLL